MLDAELEATTSVFDQIIRSTQDQQRNEARTQSPATDLEVEPATESSNESYGAMPGRSAGSGTGGAPGAGGGMRSGQPASTAATAQYPQPADIPDGDNDDVIARQLREAAMREPDPEIREKLWQEYRKYKGLNQG